MRGFPVLLLALALVAACQGATPRRLDDAIESAQSASRAGRFKDALVIIDEALSNTTTGAASDGARQLQLLKAETFISTRDIANARTVLAAVDADASDPIAARKRFLEARALLASGDSQGALSTAEEARRMSADADTRVDIDLLRGQVYLQGGRWSDAEPLLAGVASTSPDRYRRLNALNNLGMGRLVLGRYDEALTWFEQALQLSDFEGTTLYATALANAGICYSRLGLFDRAASIQRRAIQIHRQNKAMPALELALGSLGVTHGLQSDYKAALPYLQEAFEVARTSGLPGDAAIWANNLASAYSRLKEWDRAEDFNNQSRELATGSDRARPIYNTLTAAEIAAGQGDNARAATLFTEALNGAAGTASVRWSAQIGLAQTATSAGQRDAAAKYFEAALDTVERTRSDLLKTDYKLSFLTQLIEFYQGYVDALVTDGREHRALEVADSSRGRVLAELHKVNAPGLLRVPNFQAVARRTGTVLLSYWLAPRRSFLWVVSGTGVRRIELPAAEEIESIVREYRTLIDTSTSDPLARNDTPGDRLFKMLVAPAGLPANASVVIVPDGALHGVNFETLPVDGPRRHYWIEDAEVQVAPSLALLTVAPRSTPRDRSLLLIGNPTPRAPEFPALSYAPAEMTSIVRHFPQDRVTAYDSTRATPAVYRDAPLDRFSMVHFTAHASANVESPLDSAVILSGPDTGYKLYARDVAGLPLNADLVTVSACRSAGERAYSGEGLVGFAWAFLRAGAHRVIAGLWDVDDRSTARLMDSLYGGIKNGRTPAQALREAKLALIEGGGQLARPYYWGPFQLFTVTP